MSTHAPLTPGLMVLQGNQLEDLRRLVLHWLAVQPQPPLASDVFLVQSNGIAQWLKLGLAQDAASFGVAMGVDVMLPARLQWQAYRAVLGNLPRISPYDKGSLTWRLMRLLPQLIQDDPVCYRALADFLTEDTTGRKCFQLAEKIADLFDQYQIYRADWLNGWKAGLNTVDKNQALADDDLWQPALWRAIVADLPAYQQHASRADVHADFVAACSALTPETRPAGLPARVIVLGITSLAAQQLEVLSAMASCAQVIICVQNPSRHYWGDIVEGRELFTSKYRRTDAKINATAAVSDELLHLHGHPLLASWGKQGRDYLRLIDHWDNPDNYRPLFAANKLAIDVFEPPQGGGVLQHIQRDIVELASLEDIKKSGRVLDKNDQTLAFHITHSPQREVEILHDQLLKRFTDDASLSPRDVMVMVPDINAYAPHIQAVFGQYNQSDERYIPFTIADLGQREHKPLLLAINQIFSVKTQRYRANEVLSWLAVPTIRKRFDLNDDDIDTLRNWVSGSEIRWGLHGQQREQLSLPQGFEQNSWLFGISRMLLGYIAGDDFCWQEIEAYPEIAGLSAALAGSLYDFIQRLIIVWREGSTAKTAADWVAFWREQLRELCSAESDEDSDLLQQIDIRLSQWLQLCTQADFDGEISIDIVRDYILAGLDESNLQRRFLTGAVNFATLMPMRAIPFRHIYMLGMNDGAFPRQHVVPAFDLMRRAGNYRPGDRSRRDDDRYLFLEALLSARESLTISYVGRDIRDNTERTPSIVVSQLQDHVRECWQAETDAVAALSVQHPLQPFSRRYFPREPSARWFSFAREWRAASVDAAPLNVEMADWQPNHRQLNLASLAKFLQSPLQHYYASRLGVVMPSVDDHIDEETEPFALDGLTTWQLRQHIFKQVLAHWQVYGIEDTAVNSVESLVDAELQRFERAGQLPLQPFTEFHRAHLRTDIVDLLNRVLLERQTTMPLAPVAIDLSINDWQVTDSLANCYERDGVKGRWQASVSALFSGKDKRPRWDKYIDAWLAHLVLHCQLNEPLETRLLHPAGKVPAQDIVFPALDGERARELLADIIHYYQQDMQQPQILWAALGCEWLLAEKSKADELYESAQAKNLLLARHAANFAHVSNNFEWQQRVHALYQPLFDAYYQGKAQASQTGDEA